MPAPIPLMTPAEIDDRAPQLGRGRGGRKAGSEDALRAVRKQVRRNKGIGYEVVDDSLPVFGTIASQFNDGGVNAFFHAVMEAAGFETAETMFRADGPVTSKQHTIIPGHRTRYLADIAESSPSTLDASSDGRARSDSGDEEEEETKKRRLMKLQRR